MRLVCPLPDGDEHDRIDLKVYPKKYPKITTLSKLCCDIPNAEAQKRKSGLYNCEQEEMKGFNLEFDDQ